MIAKVRELDIGCAQVHGNGRRPSRADLQPIDEAAIEAWTKANERARRAYYAKPNACTHAIYKGGA